MKKVLYMLLLAAAMVAAASCVKFGPNLEDTIFSEDFDTDYEITYGLREVLQADPSAPSGKNIVDECEFFKNFHMTIIFEKGVVAGVEFDHDKMPYDIFPYAIPQGRQSAYYDTEAVPHVLRLTSGEEIAKFVGGEFIIPFTLDCESISYTYKFKTLDSTRENR